MPSLGRICQDLVWSFDPSLESLTRKVVTPRKAAQDLGFFHVKMYFVRQFFVTVVLLNKYIGLGELHDIGNFTLKYLSKFTLSFNNKKKKFKE